MYKLFKFNGEVVGAIKQEGNLQTVFGFNSPDNTDYQEYLKWVAEGNEPEPADE